MITQSQLKKLLHYNPDTGIFTWKKRDLSLFKTAKLGNPSKTWNTRFENKEAGTKKEVRGKHYNIIQIKYNGHVGQSLFRAHRLAWLYVYGEWPNDEIDHIDGNGLNNKLSNLREVTRKDNVKNARKPKDNTSGYIGVHIVKNTGMYESYIGVCGKKVALGMFTNISEAVNARERAEVKYGFHKNHGSDRPL